MRANSDHIKSSCTRCGVTIWVTEGSGEHLCKYCKARLKRIKR